jgi:transcriptional regulator with XRE-family HTH domain
MQHAFGNLLTQFRRRKSGLTQERLAHRMGYDAAVIARMAAGKKDLTGPSGRYRVLQVITILLSENVLTSIDEANALLLSAQLHPLHPAIHDEQGILTRLSMQHFCPNALQTRSID